MQKSPQGGYKRRKPTQDGDEELSPSRHVSNCQISHGLLARFHLDFQHTWHQVGLVRWITFSFSLTEVSEEPPLSQHLWIECPEEAERKHGLFRLKDQMMEFLTHMQHEHAVKTGVWSWPQRSCDPLCVAIRCRSCSRDLYPLSNLGAFFAHLNPETSGSCGSKYVTSCPDCGWRIQPTNGFFSIHNTTRKGQRLCSKLDFLSRPFLESDSWPEQKKNTSWEQTFLDVIHAFLHRTTKRVWSRNEVWSLLQQSVQHPLNETGYMALAGLILMGPDCIRPPRVEPGTPPLPILPKELPGIPLQQSLYELLQLKFDWNSVPTWETQSSVQEWIQSAAMFRMHPL